MSNKQYVLVDVDKAIEIGLIVCMCGHTKHAHNRPTNSQYCDYCTCSELFLNNFKYGSRTILLKDKKNGKAKENQNKD